jgi:hypothetical protein
MTKNEESAGRLAGAFFVAYGKDKKDDLTPREKKLLSATARHVREEAIKAFECSGGAR